MDNKPNVNQQDIVDALGGVPVIVQTNKRQQPKIVIIIVIALLAVISLLSMVLMSSDSNSDNTTSNSDQISTSNTLQQNVTGSSETASTVGAASVAQQYLDLVASGTFFEARDSHIARDTALYELSNTNDNLSVFTGSDVLWETCAVVSSLQYRAAIWTLNSREFEVTYIPVLCKTIADTTRELEFDIRKVDSSEGKIFDIITRKL